jgi:hypothetical protein
MNQRLGMPVYRAAVRRSGLATALPTHAVARIPLQCTHPSIPSRRAGSTVPSLSEDRALLERTGRSSRLISGESSLGLC